MKILSWPQTPLGPLWAQLDAEDRLTSLHWGQMPANATIVTPHLLQDVLQQYFEARTYMPHILKHIAPKGTPFQQRVWQALLEIPQGESVTYGTLAAKLNTSPRALGGAVGANPIPILIPCHRVMGQNGKLTGFSAPGGIETKQWLLRHEGMLL